MKKKERVEKLGEMFRVLKYMKSSIRKLENCYRNPLYKSLIFTVFLLSWGCVPEGNNQPVSEKDYTHELTNEQILKNFSQVVKSPIFEQISQKQPMDPDRLAKWVNPIAILIGGKDALKYVDDVEETWERIELLINRDIYNAKLANMKQNVLFFFTTHDMVREDMRVLHKKKWFENDPSPWIDDITKRYKEKGEKICHHRFFYDANYEITSAVSIIFSDYEPSAVRECILEGYLGIIGMVGNITGKTPSIFGGDQLFRDLTKHDEYLIKILYDDKIRPGMNKAQYLPLARKILEDLRKKERKE